MIQVSSSFEDELRKISSIGGVWGRLTDIFRGERSKAKRRTDYLFSEKAKKEKWRVIPRYAQSKEFVNAVQRHPAADEDLKRHVLSMHELGKGRVLGKVKSSVGSGKTYEIRNIPGGRKGCTCNAWRYKGSIDPSYKCKHIKAFEAGMTKVSSISVQTRAFADELEKILDKRREARADHDEKVNGGPWSDMLLQDEAPGEYTPQTPPLEPDILVRQP